MQVLGATECARLERHYVLRLCPPAQTLPLALLPELALAGEEASATAVRYQVAAAAIFRFSHPLGSAAALDAFFAAS